MSERYEISEEFLKEISKLDRKASGRIIEALANEQHWYEQYQKMWEENLRLRGIIERRGIIVG